jgi:hypothetical protein
VQGRDVDDVTQPRHRGGVGVGSDRRVALVDLAHDRCCLDVHGID